MLRRVKKQNISSEPQSGRTLVYGRVNGNFAAPAPMNGRIVMPTIDMNMNANVNMNANAFSYPGERYSYGDRGLDDSRALHYHGLDDFDNIDF